MGYSQLFVGWWDALRFATKSPGACSSQWVFRPPVESGISLLANAPLDCWMHLDEPQIEAAEKTQIFIPRRKAGPYIQTPGSLPGSFIPLVWPDSRINISRAEIMKHHSCSSPLSQLILWNCLQSYCYPQKALSHCTGQTVSVWGGRARISLP